MDIKLYASFSTENEFRAVKDYLDDKVAHGELLNLGANEAKFTRDIVYKSVADGREYILSHPDHAYRGYLKLK